MTSNSNTNRQMPRPVRGNSFNISIKVVARRLDGTVIDKFELDEKADVIVTNRGTVTHAPFKVTADNVAIVHFDGSLPAGIYGVDFTGHYDGEPWRFAVPAVFQVVELTTQGWLPADGIIHEPTYDVDAGVVFNVTDQPQADWAETDPRRSSFIKNKPNIYNKDEVDEQLENAVEYKSEAAPTWKTVAVGGIAKDTSPSAFEGKTISNMLDDILYPTLQPTVTQPSVAIKYKNTAPNASRPFVVEVGTVLPAKAASSANGFTYTPNRGTVSIINADGNTYYAGAVDESKRSLTMTDNAWGTSASEKQYVITYKDWFANGAELLDNKGQQSTVASWTANYNATAATVKIDAVYPIYANTGSIDSVAEQPILDYILGAVSYEVSIPAETTGDKFTFDIPSSMNAKLGKVLQYNPNSGKYDKEVPVVPLSETVVHKGVTYNRYVRTIDPSSSQGASKYQININKK